MGTIWLFYVGRPSPTPPPFPSGDSTELARFELSDVRVVYSRTLADHGPTAHATLYADVAGYVFFAVRGKNGKFIAGVSMFLFVHTLLLFKK